MSYLPFLILIIVVVFAISKQRSFKGKFEDFQFYPEESKKIASTVIGGGEQIEILSCGIDKDTETMAYLKAVARQRITNTTSGNFKSFDYYIVARTKEKYYFIPVHIVGITSLTLQPNNRITLKTYDAAKVNFEMTKDNRSDTLPSIEVKFNVEDGASHQILFYDNFGIWSGENKSDKA